MATKTKKTNGRITDNMTECKITKLCGSEATYRYTWPGEDEDVICKQCSERLLQVAAALRIHLQLISISDSKQTCPQHKKRK